MNIGELTGQLCKCEFQNASFCNLKHDWKDWDLHFKINFFGRNPVNLAGGTSVFRNLLLPCSG